MARRLGSHGSVPATDAGDRKGEEGVQRPSYAPTCVSSSAGCLRPFVLASRISTAGTSRRSLLGLICPLLTSASAVRTPCDALSSEVETRSRPPGVSSVAFRAQLPNLRFASLMNMDFATRRPLVQRSRLISGSCPSTRTFAPRFLQTPPRGNSPCASLTLHLHQVGSTERARHTTKPTASAEVLRTVDGRSAGISFGRLGCAPREGQAIRPRRFGRWPDARRTSTKAAGFRGWLRFGTGWTGDRRRGSAAWTVRPCVTGSIASHVGSGGPHRQLDGGGPSLACRKSSWLNSRRASRHARIVRRTASCAGGGSTSSHAVPRRESTPVIQSWRGSDGSPAAIFPASRPRPRSSVRGFDAEIFPYLEGCARRSDSSHCEAVGSRVTTGAWIRPGTQTMAQSSALSP
jgi:hypothetical protein